MSTRRRSHSSDEPRGNPDEISGRKWRESYDPEFSSSASARSSDDYNESDFRPPNYRQERSGFQSGPRATSSPRFYGSYGDYGSEGFSTREAGQAPLFDRDSEKNAWSPSTHYQTDSTSSRGQYYGHLPKNFSRSDERIREEIIETMMRRGNFDPTEVEITVENAEVTLEGSIESRSAKRELEDLCADVMGVQDVANHLKVKRKSEDTLRQSSDSTRNVTPLSQARQGASKSASNNRSS